MTDETSPATAVAAPAVDFDPWSPGLAIDSALPAETNHAHAPASAEFRDYIAHVEAMAGIGTAPAAEAPRSAVAPSWPFDEVRAMRERSRRERGDT